MLPSSTGGVLSKYFLLRLSLLGNNISLEEESFENNLLEAPAFTKPNIFNDLSVPKEFLKGNHAKIHDLKNKLSICKTKYYRP
jgi:tRNA (guanine37-N1)-methyltransferase